MKVIRISQQCLLVNNLKYNQNIVLEMASIYYVVSCIRFTKYMPDKKITIQTRTFNDKRLNPKSKETFVTTGDLKFYFLAYTHHIPT